jgi:hypothetical protein
MVHSPSTGCEIRTHTKGLLRPAPHAVGLNLHKQLRIRGLITSKRGEALSAIHPSAIMWRYPCLPAVGTALFLLRSRVSLCVVRHKTTIHCLSLTEERYNFILMVQYEGYEPYLSVRSVLLYTTYCRFGMENSHSPNDAVTPYQKAIPL